MANDTMVESSVSPSSLIRRVFITQSAFTSSMILSRLLMSYFFRRSCSMILLTCEGMAIEASMPVDSWV